MKIENIYNEYIKSEDSEIIWKYCDQIENDTLKNELEKFIFNALTELNKNKFIFSLYILQGYEFNFKNNDKHFEYITKAIISFLNNEKENKGKIKSDISFIISEFFDIINKLGTKYDELLIYTFKELPHIVFEISKIKFKRGSHMEIAMLKSMNLLTYKLNNLKESIIVLEEIKKDHFDDGIVEEADDLLKEIKNYG